jgi:dipeptide/tripeptide permease
MAANPVIVIFVGLLVASILLVLALLEKNVPALLLAGAGIVLIAAGVILASIGPVRESFIGFSAAFLLISVGEVVAGPALISRIAGDVHWRLTTLFVALWLITSQLGYGLSGLVTGSGLAESPFGLPLAFAVISLPIGLVLLAVAVPLQRRLFDPKPSAGQPAPGAVVAQQ